MSYADSLPPPDMIGDVLDGSPSLAELMSDLITPILRERDTIRGYLGDQGYITELPTTPPTYGIGCADGAYVISPLAIGDHHTTLAVAVTEDLNGSDLTGHRSWSGFQSHTGSSDLLGKAVMMTHELQLLSTFPANTVGIIDGSHATHITAITDLLTNADPSTQRSYGTVFTPDEVVAAVEYALSAPTIIAQQKQDSSSAIWEDCARNLNLTGGGLPDKPLSALVLHPGEVLTHPDSAPSWDRVRRNTTGAPTGSVLYRVAELAAPMVRDNKITVSHIKPVGGDFVLRVETKASLDSYTRRECHLAVAANCAPPHMQEPLVQYLADKFAKNVATVSSVQLEMARLDTADAGYPELLNYVLHYYRT